MKTYNKHNIFFLWASEASEHSMSRMKMSDAISGSISLRQPCKTADITQQLFFFICQPFLTANKHNSCF